MSENISFKKIQGVEFAIYNAVGNGLCFYNAICQCLHQQRFINNPEKEILPSYLCRQGTLQFMNNRIPEYERHVPPYGGFENGEEGFYKFIAKSLLLDEFVNNEVIIEVENLLNILMGPTKIWMYRPNENKFRDINSQEHSVANITNNEFDYNLYLYFEPEAHYQSMFLQQDWLINKNIITQIHLRTRQDYDSKKQEQAVIENPKLMIVNLNKSIPIHSIKTENISTPQQRPSNYNNSIKDLKQIRIEKDKKWKHSQQSIKRESPEDEDETLSNTIKTLNINDNNIPKEDNNNEMSFKFYNSKLPQIKKIKFIYNGN